MDILDNARKLGELLQKTDQFKEFEKAKKNNDDDANLNEAIGRLNMLKLELNEALNKNLNDEFKKAKNKELLKVYKEIDENENFIKFKEANANLNSLVAKINTIIYNCANGQDPKTCPDKTQCLGDCKSCGGCN